MKNNIKRKTLPVALESQAKEGEKVPAVNNRAHSPMPKVSDFTNMTSTLENIPRPQDRRSPGFDDGGKPQHDSIGPSEAAPAPITLMPLPQIPTRHSNQSEVIYAEPNVCDPSDLKPRPTTALYVDPVDVLPLKPPLSREPDAAGTASSEASLNSDVPDSVYSEVYDKIIQDRNQQEPPLRAGKPAEEPIYTQPIKTEQGSETRETPKPDPFAHLYAQVCKASSKASTSISTASSMSASPSVTVSPNKPTEGPVDDVIYENLGII